MRELRLTDRVKLPPIRLVGVPGSSANLCANGASYVCGGHRAAHRLYRARNLIERFFNKIKQCRRIPTRYDKLAANYLAFIKLASIRIWLRANESTP